MVYYNLETLIGEIRLVIALKDEGNILWPDFKDFQRPFKWRAGHKLNKGKGVFWRMAGTLIKPGSALNWRSEGK